MLGHEKIGSGSQGVIVLNDWLCDTSTWDPARPYLDRQRFTWVFADLRGYGRSRTIAGENTLTEAAADVLSLADALGWRQFSLIGHSMSTLITLHLAQHAPERVTRAIVLTPAPPRGLELPEEAIRFMENGAAADDETRLSILRERWGNRLSSGWIKFKAKRWRETSDTASVVRYIRLYAQHGLPDPTRRITVPLLALTCEQDAPNLRRENVGKLLPPLCDQLTIVSFEESGHYPMQEMPPLLVTTVERFLAA
jgi:pimeloyl-ACP methyl ester carboxylesterase